MLKHNVDLVKERNLLIFVCCIIFVFTNRELVCKNIDGLVIADLIGQVIGMVIVGYIFLKMRSKFVTKQN